MPSQNIQPTHISRRLIRPAILRWYRKHQRDLFWRGGNHPFPIWVSEIMLQQTRVDQGTPYIARFLDTFPTIHELASASEEEVLKVWEGLGYYSRARNMHRAAKKIVQEYDGEFPTSVGDWQALPGVGRYTAGAICSIAYGLAVPVLDGNVKRVLARVLDLKNSIDDAKVNEALWEVMTHLVQGKSPGDFNQGMMELGSEVCTPRNPSCDICPIQKHCLANSAGTQSIRPVRKERKKVPHKEIVVAAIFKNGRYLLGKRPSEGLLGGLWEFPGGKVETGESHEDALIRECREELGIEIKPAKWIACVHHAYSHFKVTLNVYRCGHVNGSAKALVHTELKWVLPSKFEQYPFPKANHKFLELL
jgi:A/G-specific adenine glycosylase